MEHFGPISLCNLAYKIFTKIISSRIKPILEYIISPSQSAFIPNRGMNDKIIISHEMHHLNKKRGKMGLMAIEIDMAEAYDKVEWKVFINILKCNGFHDCFINLINACLSAVSFSILVNGSPYGFFSSSRNKARGPYVPSFIHHLCFIFCPN